jgi:hypothetical protein
MQIRVEASDPPGRTCGPGGGFPGYSNVHVGVQRRDRRNELLELHPGTPRPRLWTLARSALSISTGVDIRAPGCMVGADGYQGPPVVRPRAATAHRLVRRHRRLT